MRRSVGLALAMAAVVVAVLLAVLGPGWSYAVLASPSMQPYAGPGDLLLHRHVPAAQVEVGDVITVVGADGRLVTHRVVRLTGTGETRTARLKGDRSRLPDPVPVELRGDVARVEAAVPRLGDVLTLGAPALWGGTALLVSGIGVLLLAGRGRDDEPSEGSRSEAAPGSDPSSATSVPSLDPRLEALLATCEQLAEDGVDPVVLRDVVRIRAAAIAGLPSAERAGAVLALDDGARFYVLACADVDNDALALVPSRSERRRDATAALDLWWEAMRDHLAPATREALEPWVSTRQ